MKLKIIALSLLFSFPAHACCNNQYGELVTIDLTKTINVFNLPWEFANNPNWQNEMVPGWDCAWVSIIWGAFFAWELTQVPPLPIVELPPIIVVDNPPFIEPPIDIVPPPFIKPPFVVNVPETSTWLMMLMSLCGMGILYRRRQCPAKT